MYRLKRDRLGHKKGTVVYDCAYHDYGCANDDSRLTGIEHTSVTTDPDGGYPFFTVALYDLEKIQ